jgi:hypothetical protein
MTFYGIMYLFTSLIYWNIINSMKMINSALRIKTIRLLTVLAILLPGYHAYGQSDYLPGEALRQDFIQFRNLLEENHCCLYEYTSKALMDSLFEANFNRISDSMRFEDYFRLLAPITARIGCMHTATWMPGRFFNPNSENMFPLKFRLIEGMAVVTGSYNDSSEVPRGSVLLEINGIPVSDIIDSLRTMTSADALNPWFMDAQLTRRFSMFYASYFGFPEEYIIMYALPGRKTSKTVTVSPASLESVRAFVFSHFNDPPLRFEILEEKNAALITIETFIYYDRVDYFRSFMDSAFHLIKGKKIDNLILDLRGNDGGDPFCSVVLLSYLEKEPVPYFAEPYGRYGDLALPTPLAKDHFTGNLYTFVDGSCGSTNGHFCALLKYNKIGKFVGTPSGSTYKCNAGRNTEFRLDNSQIIITLGRSTYSAAVSGMDKRSPIMPDIRVNETYRDFLADRDPYLEAAFAEIATLASTGQ